MDWSKVNTPPPPRPIAPAPELIDLCSRMRGPSLKILSIGVYRNGGILEVRACYGDDDLVRSVRVQSIGDGHAKCDEWRRALLEQGSWREMHTEA